MTDIMSLHLLAKQLERRIRDGKGGAKEPAVRDELTVFEVCVIIDRTAVDEFVDLIVQPTAVLAKTADEAKLHGVRLADKAHVGMGDASKPLDVSRLTVLVRPFA